MDTNLLTIHSVDLAEKECEICKGKIYPAILSSLKGKWKYGYVCIDCIEKTGAATKEELKRTQNNFIQGHKVLDFMKESWEDDPEKLETLNEFVKFELEERAFIEDDRLLMATMFKNALKDGRVMYSELEMFEYMNFYGNNPDIVFKLREMISSGNKNKFINDIYVKARTTKLSKKEIEAVKRNKEMKDLSVDIQEFWNILPMLNEYIKGIEKETEEISKIKSILRKIAEDDFFTKGQRYTINKFIQENLIYGGTVNEA